jgi:hypothetical protein
VVAHNFAFDAPFLAPSSAGSGLSVPLAGDRGLCTMRLARHFLPVAARSLEGCRAAADLLGLYLRMTGEPPPWSLRVDERPALPPCTALPVQRRRPEERERHFLTRLLDRLPRSADPRGDSYLDRLDRALADRHISGTVTWCIHRCDESSARGSAAGRGGAGLAVGENVTRKNSPAGRRRPRLDVGQGQEGPSISDPDRPSGRLPGNARRAEGKRLTFSVSSEKSGRSGGCLCTPDRCLHGEEDC